LPPTADGMPPETTRTDPTSMRSGCCSLQALAPTRFADTAQALMALARRRVTVFWTMLRQREAFNPDRKTA